MSTRIILFDFQIVDRSLFPNKDHSSSLKETFKEIVKILSKDLDNFSIEIYA